MRTFRKIMAVALALLLVCGFAACGKKETKKKEKKRNAQQIVMSAPLALDVFSDADVTIGFDKNGKALAIISYDPAGETVAKACKNITGKSGVDAVNMVLKAILDNDFAKTNYVVLRQRMDSTLPSKDYLTKIVASAEKTLGEVKLFTIFEKDMDNTGYISGEYAAEILKHYVGNNAKVLGISELIDGCYIISCESDVEALTDYSVSGYSGVIGPYTEITDIPIEEEDMIPENEQFDIPSDNPEESA